MRRTMTNGVRNESGFVDEYIGSSYDIVKAVYEALPEIRVLSAVASSIPTVAQEAVDAALEGALPSDDADRAETAANAAVEVLADVNAAVTQVASVINGATNAAEGFKDDAEEAAQAAALSAALALENETTASNGAIIGLKPSVSTSFPNSHITIAIGAARDMTNSHNIKRTAVFSKSILAPWVPGDSNGGRDQSAAFLANDSIHMFIIRTAASDVGEFLFSKSPTNPTLPFGYIYCRRIFSFILDSAVNIRPFICEDDWTWLVTRGVEWAATTNGVAAGTLRDIGVPKGLRLEVEFYYQSQGVGGSNPNPALSGIYDPIRGVPTFGTSSQWAQIRAQWATATERYQTRVIRQWCNTNAQVYTASNDTGDTIAGGVLGWRDPRKLI